MPFFLNLCRSLPIILVHGMTPRAPYLTGADLLLNLLIFLLAPSLTFLSSSFLVQSGMLARPSSVGGGPHIPPCRSTTGGGGRNKGDGGRLVTQNTHTHTSHTPPRILSEASCSSASRVSHNTALCESKVSHNMPKNTKYNIFLNTVIFLRKTF